MTGAIDAGLATAYILNAMITELNERSRDILRLVVEAYVETGGPIGSRTLSQRLNQGLSAATIRNAMADLEDAGLLYAPHTSAGRVPTEQGYRFFVDAIIDRTHQRRKARKTALESKIIDRAREVSGRTNDMGIVIDEEDGEVRYLGMKRVFENPEFRTHESVVSLLGDLERFEDYSETIYARLTKDLEIFIGSENPFFENQDYGMISARYNDSLIALLGPMRMNYKVNLSLLL